MLKTMLHYLSKGSKKRSSLSFLIVFLILSLGGVSYAQNIVEPTKGKHESLSKYPEAKELILYFQKINKKQVLEIHKSLNKFPEKIVEVYFDDRYNTFNIIYSKEITIKEIYDVVNQYESHFLRLTAKPTDMETLDSFIQENNVEKQL